MTEDKDYRSFYRIIKHLAEEIIITPPSSFKKSFPRDIFNEVKNIFKKTVYIEKTDEAVFHVLKKNKPLLVTGSFYLAGPFLEIYKNISQKN